MSTMLQGKNAIIYGGAGGIGTGVAQAFAREGAKVLLVGRSKDKLDQAAGESAPETSAALETIASMSVLRRAPRLAEVAEVATFLTSDRASGMTGSMTNVTSGLVLR